MQAGVNRYIRPRSTDILRLVTKEVFQVSRDLILGRDVKLGIFWIAGGDDLGCLGDGKLFTDHITDGIAHRALMDIVLA